MNNTWCKCLSSLSALWYALSTYRMYVNSCTERSSLYVFHILKMYLIRTICAFTFSAQDSAFNVLVHWPFKDCNPGSYLCLQLTPFPATSSSCLLWIPVQMHVLTTTVLCKSLVSPLISLYFASDNPDFLVIILNGFKQHFSKLFKSFSLDTGFFSFYFQSSPLTWPLFVSFLALNTVYDSCIKKNT